MYSSSFITLECTNPLLCLKGLCSEVIAPMIYTATCVMYLLLADTLRGQVGEGWVQDIESFWAPWKGIEPIGECHLGPKTRNLAPYLLACSCNLLKLSCRKNTLLRYMLTDLQKCFWEIIRNFIFKQLLGSFSVYASLTQCTEKIVKLSNFILRLHENASKIHKLLVWAGSSFKVIARKIVSVKRAQNINQISRNLVLFCSWKLCFGSFRWI